MTIFKKLTRFNCHHRWSDPSTTRRSLGSATYSEWFCLDCGTRRRSAII